MDKNFEEDNGMAHGLFLLLNCCEPNFAPAIILKQCSRMFLLEAE